jgi:hypothetical protein
MSQQKRQETIWTKPQLVRLGKLADVAGAQTPLAQGNSAKT